MWSWLWLKFALAEEDVVSSTTLFIVALWWSQLYTVQPTSTRLVVWKSVDDTHVYSCVWHGASHAGCAVVEHARTMRVQNCAGSGIKRDSVAESAARTDTPCVCVIQLQQSVARSLGDSNVTRSSATAEGPRDVLCQLIYCQMLHKNVRRNRT